LHYPLKVFSRSEQIGEIIVVLRKAHYHIARKIISRLKIRDKRIVFVEGGRRRQDSVMNGLQALSGNIRYVLIHDAARPFVNYQIVERVLKNLRRYPTVIPAVGSRDTLKLVNSRRVVKKTLNREGVFCVQTPQGFRKEILMNAYRQYRGKRFFDDAQVVESLGVKVKVVEGDICNFKITYPQDVKLAEILAKSML
jgi:2-C-methyl-D-erythritol 4-phosphate cytidylyltransferase